MLSPPQGMENARLFLLLRTDILQKTVVGCPCLNTCQSFDGANIMKKQDVGQIVLPFTRANHALKLPLERLKPWHGLCG